MEPQPDLSDLPHHTGLEGRVAGIVAPALAGMGYELVRVAMLGRERPTVQIMADRADGGLITVDDCEAISRAVGAVLDVEDPIPGGWTLEVSSAGIDRPLTRGKDWNRFAGHLARAENGGAAADGRKRFSGTVLGADATRPAARGRGRGGPAARRHPPRETGADRRPDRGNRNPRPTN